MRRTNFCLLIVMVVAGCGAKKQNSIAANIDSRLFQTHFKNTEKLIIFPCTRCGCLVTSLNNLSPKDFHTLEKYLLVTDTNCNKIKLPSRHMNQSGLDSLSPDFYNLTLVKKNSKGLEIRIIQTEESSKLTDICKDFFER